VAVRAPQPRVWRLWFGIDAFTGEGADHGSDYSYWRPASFKANYGARLPRKEREHLPPREFSTHYRLFSRVDAMELETVLRRVHANTNNLIHGRPLS
jgi:hypothetical protein